MRDANFLMRTLTSAIKANKWDKEMSHALSLLWKYVVVIVDQCLHHQVTQYKHLEKKFDMLVEEKVEKRM